MSDTLNEQSVANSVNPPATAWWHAWDSMVAAVGQDLSDGRVRWGADAIEVGTLRRFCEPLELGSRLHHDREFARSLGYDDVVAPLSAMLSYTIPATWSPGDPPQFVSDDRNAQPARSPINNTDPGPGPRTRGFFATDFEIDVLRPVTAGERLGMRGRKLLSCEPKETSVGCGAFCKFESEIVSDRGDVVARVRTGTYAYDPHPRAST